MVNNKYEHFPLHNIAWRKVFCKMQSHKIFWERGATVVPVIGNGTVEGLMWACMVVILVLFLFFFRGVISKISKN